MLLIIWGILVISLVLVVLKGKETIHLPKWRKWPWGKIILGFLVIFVIFLFIQYLDYRACLSRRDKIYLDYCIEFPEPCLRYSEGVRSMLEARFPCRFP